MAANAILNCFLDADVGAAIVPLNRYIFTAKGMKIARLNRYLLVTIMQVLIIAIDATIILYYSYLITAIGTTISQRIC